MAEPFLSEIRMFSFGFAPKGWALCDGQLLPINQNQGLFSLLGTTYGGDGRVNFALPDLRSRIPVHTGNGITLGDRAGEEAHTLNISEMAAHSHAPGANSGAADQQSPQGNFWASNSSVTYSTAAPNTTMASGLIGTAGG